MLPITGKIIWRTISASERETTGPALMDWTILQISTFSEMADLHLGSHVKEYIVCQEFMGNVFYSHTSSSLYLTYLFFIFQKKYEWN